MQKFQFCKVKGQVGILNSQQAILNMRMSLKNGQAMGKELFTSADNYVLDISCEVPANSELKKLILAAVMCIDIVLKE